MNKGFIAYLLKDKLGLTATFVLTFSVIVALLGYAITPDKTTNAAQQALSLSALTPGSTATFLTDIDTNSSWNNVLIGKPVADATPIVVIYTTPDSIFYKKQAEAQIDPHAIVHSVAKKTKKVNHFTYWLGSDGLGRDLLSRLILGLRVTLGVGFGAVLISLFIGIALGAIAGYFKGFADTCIQFVINITWSIPSLLLVIAFSLVLGKGFWQIFLAIGLTMWVDVARLVRGEVMRLREMAYVQSAQALGYNDFTVIVKEILPNVAAPVAILTASNFAAAILIESGLSFLGLGVQPPVPTLGVMIKENYTYLIAGMPHLTLVPGIAIVLLVLSFNWIGKLVADYLIQTD